MMSLTSRPNECASRAVIALQLATWSAVGIILLQKGASSLQRSNAALMRNASLAQNGVPADVQIEIHTFGIQRRYEEGSNLAVIPLQADSSAMVTERRPARSDRQTTWSGDLLNTLQASKNDAGQEPDGSVLPSEKSAHEDPANKRMENNTVSTTGSEADDSTKKDRSEFDNSKERRGGRDNIPPEVKAARASAPAGTVAAIAMLAVGAVMLVLGPAAVILRALDDRRQKSRFLKLSAADDLPPTYEQATLMDEAPRYSTLVLNRSDSAVSTSQMCAAVESVEQSEPIPSQPVQSMSLTISNVEQ